MQIEDIEIVATAIEAITNPEMWDVLCDKIAERLDVQAFMLQEYNIEAHATPVFYASSLVRTAEGGRLLSNLTKGTLKRSEEQPGYQALADATTGQVIGEAEAFGFDPMGPPVTNPLRDRILGVTRSTARSALRLNQIGPWMDVAITCENQVGFKASTTLAKHAPNLSALLQKTMESKRLIARLTGSYAALLDFFDRLNFGVALCDSQGGIIVANEKLRDWLRENDALKTENNRVVATIASCNAGLTSALKNSASLRSGSQATTVSLARRSGETSLVAHVTSVRDAKIHGNTSALILVMDPAAGRHIEADGLSAIAALTPAETDICNLLLRGLEVSSVCHHRGTQLETVRGQIKSIMQKLECKRRADLVRLAMVTSPNLYVGVRDTNL